MNTGRHSIYRVKQRIYDSMADKTYGVVVAYNPATRSCIRYEISFLYINFVSLNWKENGDSYVFDVERSPKFPNIYNLLD